MYGHDSAMVDGHGSTVVMAAPWSWQHHCHGSTVVMASLWWWQHHGHGSAMSQHFN
jgi:hypothetical protein